MTKPKQKILIPQYMHDFKCIGSKCEDSCCIGWRVNIDKVTFKKYKNCRNKALKDMLNKKITRNRSNPSDNNYAKIKMDKKKCPFLNTEKLCTIQLEVGEDYLSDTCTSYPRITKIVNGVIERSATMSCPEAARLALLNPEVMEFDELLVESPIRNIVNKIIDTNLPRYANKPQKYFWPLRIFTIGLIQNRHYQLWERLIILGLFYQKVDECVKQSDVNQIPQLIISYTNMLEEGLFKDYLEKIPSRCDVQIKLLKELADARVLQGVNNERYLDCFSKFLKGIEHKEDVKLASLSENYIKAFNQFYGPYMSKYQYILENYLVNYIFKNLFPFSGKKDIFDNYVMLVIHYAMIKMHLIGMAGYYQENFNTNHILQLIQSFSKTVEHNHTYLNQVYNLFKDHDFNTMAFMAIFIKNN